MLALWSLWQATIMAVWWLAMAALVVYAICCISQRIFSFTRVLRGGEPKQLKETVPFISNALRCLRDMKTFTKQAREFMDAENAIVQFFVGPMRVYIVSSAKNVQAVFRASDKATTDELFLNLLRRQLGASDADVGLAKRYRHDSRLHKNDNKPSLSGFHHVIPDHLTRGVFMRRMAESYQGFWAEQLDDVDGEVCLFQLLSSKMALAAAMSLAGRRNLEINPDFLDAMDGFTQAAPKLAFGPPRWLPGFGKHYARRDRFLDMGARWLRAACDEFDWSGPDADVDWEPIFGSCLMRQLCLWYKEAGFSFALRSAVAATTVWAMNINTLPATFFALLEILKSPGLVPEIRREISTALIQPSPVKFDMDKLVKLPLLQSVYYETLRLHVSVNLPRNLVQSMNLDGFKLRKGALLVMPTLYAHLNDRIWEKDGHPADEFWAERHVEYIQELKDGKKTTIFAPAGQPGDWFPYGGGSSICPGRDFAKPEIILTVAMLIWRFDMEIIGWTSKDGVTRSEPVAHDANIFGTGSCRPDGDVRLRLKSC